MEADATPDQVMQAMDETPKSNWRTRLIWILLVLLVVISALVVPPLVNVGRYRLRIAQSITDAMGRPVHIDDVSLTMFPTPGFTLQNFVVSEDPAFGAEPVLRANQVHVTLRLGSLWRRKLEASSISLTDPSMNLVRSDDGRWNVQGIMLHASQVDTAPTVQAKAGDAPRFPYIEATNARVNLKLGTEKTPFSLTEAQFALWLPDSQEWRIRLEAHPSRTDTDASDTGIMRIEGTLKRAEAFQKIPIDLHAVWTQAQLGETSKILTGGDAGLRGTMEWGADVKGTFGESQVQTWIKVDGLRRQEFFPAKPVGLELHCGLRTLNDFLTLEDVNCTAPLEGGAIALTGRMPDVREPAKAEIKLTSPGIPASTLLDWGRFSSNRFAAQLVAAGSLDGSLAYQPQSGWTGGLNWKKASLSAGSLSILKDIDLVTVEEKAPVKAEGLERIAFALQKVPMDFGGKDPIETDFYADSKDASIHLAGNTDAIKSKLIATALGPIGDGITPLLPSEGTGKVDAIATRSWNGTDWLVTAPVRSAPAKARSKRR